MSLKEITKDLHHDAEITQFAQLLLSGNISKEDYAKYLYQMLVIYRPLELGIKLQGLFNKLPGLERDQAIYEDFMEIAETGKQYIVLNSTVGYYNYLISLSNQPDRRHLLRAHMYVRHMGDLFGGQIIKRQVAKISSGKFYNFENAEELKTNIRELLTDDLGPEARVAFEWAIRIMLELNGGK